TCRPSRGATSTSWMRAGSPSTRASYVRSRAGSVARVREVQRKAGNVRRREEFVGPADLARFFRGDRLEVIPRREADRGAVLGFIAQRFERGRDYPEAEVNSLLLAAHDDIAMLRRYLVDARLLARANGRYRRI